MPTTIDFQNCTIEELAKHLEPEKLSILAWAIQGANGTPIPTTSAELTANIKAGIAFVKDGENQMAKAAFQLLNVLLILFKDGFPMEFVAGLAAR